MIFTGIHFQHSTVIKERIDLLKTDSVLCDLSMTRRWTLILICKK